MADESEGARWLSYAELAALRGISVASAVRLVRRRKWARSTGNDGTVRAAVPVGVLTPTPDTTQDTPGDTTPDMSRDMTRTIEVLEATLERERQRGDAERAEWVAERDRLLSLIELLAPQRSPGWWDRVLRWLRKQS